MCALSIKRHRLHRYFPEVLVVHTPQLLPQSLLSPSLPHTNTLRCRIMYSEVIVIEGYIYIFLSPLRLPLL